MAEHIEDGSKTNTANDTPLDTPNTSTQIELQTMRNNGDDDDDGDRTYKTGKIYSILNDLKDDVKINEIPRHGTVTESDARNEYRDFMSNGKLFIQRNDNFTETTPEEILGINCTNRNDNKKPHLDIDYAIMIQKSSHTIANLCYGFLGGISLMQLVLTYTLVSGSRHELLAFIQMYSKIAEVPTASFSILTTVCFVFSCDRLDPSRLKKNQSCAAIRFNHWLLVLTYGVMLILSIICFTYDEMIILYPTVKGQIHLTRELHIWRTLNLWRCIFGISGWTLICIAEPNDLLEQYLIFLKDQYEDTKKTEKKIIE